MTEQTQTSPSKQEGAGEATNASNEPQKQTQAQPVVDEAKITAEATKKAEAAAAKIAEAKMKEVFAKLAGQEPEEEADPIHVAFAKDPKGLLKAHADIIEERVQKSIAQRDAQLRADQKAVQPVLEEYPDLNTPQKMKYAILEAERLMRESEGMSREEALKAGFKSVAKDMGLKALSEKEREEAAKRAAIPPVGMGYQLNGQKRESEIDLMQKFIAGRRAVAKSQRSKTRPGAG